MKNSISQKLEYWDGNNFYGIGNILRRYARLPFYVPLNFRIQHGVVLFSIFPTIEDCAVNIDFYIPRQKHTYFLMYSKAYMDFFHKNNILNVRAIGSPIIYMDNVIERFQTGKKKGTIVFPNHSTHYSDCLTDYDEYARQLEALPGKFHPIRICMYYLDVEKGVDRPFRERGFEVVCNGSLWSANFLHNFIRNVSGCEYASSNHNASSAAFYSIFLGLKYFRYGPGIDYELKGYYVQKYQKGYSLMKTKHLYDFPLESCDDAEPQKAAAETELGVRSKLTRSEMRRLIMGGINREFLMDYAKTVLPRFRFGGPVLRGLRVVTAFRNARL